MELGRQNAHRANSSEEQEIHGDHHTEKGVSGSRSVSYYECTFCKRGFTNAQALGGHMNIHRKDKSKAKPKLPKSKPSPHQTTYMNKELSTSHIPPSTTFSRADLGFGESGFYNTQMCYYSPLAPPSFHAFNPNPNSSQLGFQGGEPGFDLGLQIGSSTKYGDREEEIEDVDEGGLVDLELRLGRPPRR